MGACPGSQWLARKLKEIGRDGHIIPAQFVKPYVKSHKNDLIDAEAIAEAQQELGRDADTRDLLIAILVAQTMVCACVLKAAGIIAAPISRAVEGGVIERIG